MESSAAISKEGMSFIWNKYLESKEKIEDGVRTLKNGKLDHLIDKYSETWKTLLERAIKWSRWVSQDVSNSINSFNITMISLVATKLQHFDGLIKLSNYEAELKKKKPAEEFELLD